MERATIDILPECLIEKIVSYLSFKDAAKMSILSKTWLRSWLIHPNIEFKYPYSGRDLELVDTIMNRYRDEKIPIDKFELSYYNFSYHIIVKWLDIAVTNGAKYLFFKVCNFSLPIFTILAGKSLTELVVESCTLIPVSLFSSGVMNCNSLRKISLCHVKLDKNLLQTLLNCCPLIVSFIFNQCCGLKKIELLNLQKTKSVSIKNWRELNQLVKIQAPTLEHLSCDDHLGGKLDIVECENLKSLDISHARISDGFLQNLISRSQSLKDLKIQFCGGIMEIDSSNLNLESLEYMGYKIPKLKIARQLKHLEIVLECSGSLKAAWFCNLRKFLSISTSCPQVSLICFQCNDINLTDLQGFATPKVDVLNVNCTWMDGEYPTFLDALLWSCHPRRLDIRSTSATFECFINSLINMKNMSQYSPLHGQLQLKGAQVYIFDDNNRSQSWHRVELNREELSIRFNWKWEMVNYYFLLDW